MTRSWKSIVMLGVFAGCLLAPAGSQATLVFTRNLFNPTVYVASDNGSAARKVGAGSNPRVSPDGQTIVLYRFGKGDKPAELMVAAASGGAVKKLAGGWQDPFVFAWSPDSKTIAVLLGPEIGVQRLTTIDVTTGAQRTIARGFFNGVSFAPEGPALVYGRSTSEIRLKERRLPLRRRHPRRRQCRCRTAPPPDHRPSIFEPALGAERHDRLRQASGRKDAQVRPEERPLPDEPERQGRQSPHPHQGRPTTCGPQSRPSGRPAASSCSAEFGGQDTSYAVTVNPKTGAEQALTSEREVGFVGTTLSKDGKLVLGSLGGFEPGPGHKVVSIPYTGGKPKVLANNAAEPDWSR